MRGDYIHRVLLLCALLCCAVNGQVKKGESKRMASADVFFNKIGMQLITTPAESRAALEKAAAGSLGEPEIPGAGVAVRMARAWTRNILADAYQPPNEARFVPFRREDGGCDVVRSLYHAGGLEIEVAQTFSMFSVTVKNLSARESEGDLARAERVAMLLLKSNTPISFQSLGKHDGLVMGKQQASYDPLNCDWSELLRWWTKSDSIGFITVKTTKGPERAVVGPEEEENTVWFDLYKPR